MANVERHARGELTYHTPDMGQVDKYKLIREKAEEFGRLLLEITPESPEQSLALTNLDYCVMMAAYAIARGA